jgi:hypothetical protein
MNTNLNTNQLAPPVREGTLARLVRILARQAAREFLDANTDSSAVASIAAESDAAPPTRA